MIIVNTSDEGGGAERISMAMLDGFAARGIDTWLLVGNKKTDNSRVLPFHLSPFFNYRPYGRRHRQVMLDSRRWVDRRLGLEDLGPILSCGRDGAMIEGFNPAIAFTRTQTIMQGAPHCDFRYRKPG